MSEERLEHEARAAHAARSACEVYLAQAREVLAQRSGVPRGTWAYWKGVGDVASRVAALLEVEADDDEW